MAPVYGESKRCALVPEGSGSSGGTAATSESAVYRRALGETFRRFHAGLVRMLSVRTGSVEDAKEIMQEAYARIIALDHPGAIGQHFFPMQRVYGKVVLEFFLNPYNKIVFHICCFTATEVLPAQRTITKLAFLKGRQ